MRALVFPLAAALAVAACGPSPNSATGGRTGAQSPAAARTLKIVDVKGSVIAPPGWKAGDKAPEAAIDASKATTKKYDLLDKGEAVANVEVWLGTPKRERLKGPAVATTNAKGEFVIKNVPRDLSYVVYASVVDASGEVKTSEVAVATPPPPPPQNFCTLMPPPPANNQPPKPIVISFASSLVVQDILKGAGNKLAQIDWNAFGKAVVAVDAKLDLKALPNLQDPTAITNFLGTVQVDGKAVTDFTNAAAAQIQKVGVDGAAIQSALNGLNGITFSGSGSVSQDGQQVGAGSTEGTIVIPQGLDLGGLLGGGTAPAAEPSPSASPSASPAP